MSPQFGIPALDASGEKFKRCFVLPTKSQTQARDSSRQWLATGFELSIPGEFAIVNFFIPIVRLKEMNAVDVSQIIKDQVGTIESLPNSHAIDLRRCLTTPNRIKVTHRRVLNGKSKDSTETVWLVLEERPAEKDGYKIIFNEQTELFGLASQGFPKDPFPVLCGYYGDFPTTLASM